MADSTAAPPDTGAELTLNDVRARLRVELLGVALNPEGAELDGAEVAALADAYRTLGGDLELPPVLPAPRLNPGDARVIELATAAAWQAASAKGATPDTVADAVRLKLVEASK